MKKAIAFKLSFIFVIAFFIIGFIYYFHKISEDYFINSNKVLFDLNTLKRNEFKLTYNILYINFYISKSNDDIAKLIKRQSELIDALLKNDFLKNFYPSVYKELIIYKKAFKKKKKFVFEYLKYALPINNSILFLSNALPYVTPVSENSRYKLLRLISKIILIQISNDLELLKTIKFEEYAKLLDKRNIYNKAFLNNLRILLEFYPKKSYYLNKVLDISTLKIIEKMLNGYLINANKNIIFFQKVLIAIIIIILILFIFISILVYKLEINLKKITYLANYDQLTELKNRVSYKDDLEKFKKPSLIILDIDRFKNINDYFGNKIGDEVLVSFARELKKFASIIPYKIEIYRFGSDEFGILADNLDIDDMLRIAHEFIKQVENKVLIEKYDLSISVSGGISQQKPLLENADIALKEAKNDWKRKVVVFKNEFNKKIEENLKKVDEIKKALENDNIIPYFQGIFDKNGNIYKYEVLGRVKVGNEIRSIFPYLQVVKENKMYYHITLRILEKSLEVLKKKSDINLSINLALEDILDGEIKSFIFENFCDSLAKRVGFEILESEIGNYDEVDEFIKRLKTKGVSFAIDDFGSGYSSFVRIVKLKVDYIKIDGSIIKNIDKDPTSLSILKTIVNFAKENNLKTVAEFIHNKEVFEIAKSVGVDYFQGFYLHKPSPFEKI